MANAIYGTGIYGTDLYTASPYPETHVIKVEIAGVDVSSKVSISNNINVENVLTRQIDTCDLTIYNMAGLSIKEWDEIIIYIDGTRFFGGFVMTITKAFESGTGGVYATADLSCVDYAGYLDHVFAKSSHVGQTDKQIITELFSTLAPDFLVGDLVESVLTFPKIRFNRVTLRQVMDQLSEASGGDWYVDQFKRVHYFLNFPVPAPFAFSDAYDMVNAFPLEDLQENKSGTGVINRVEVIGGEYLSTDQTIYVAGTGQDTKVTLPFKMSAASTASAVQIWRNDGTLGTPIWTPLSVLVGYIDKLTTTSQVLYYYNEKVIETLSAAPNLANAFKIVGRYPIPLRTRVTDDASVAFYGGKIFDGFIIDKEVVDKSVAQQKALGLMARSAFGEIAVTCTVRMLGLAAGQRVTITNSVFGYSDRRFVIQRVKTSISMSGIIVCSLDLGLYRPDFYDIMIQLARRSRQLPDWDENEVLDEFLQTYEGISMFTEEVAVQTRTGTKWGADANALIWSFGRWS